MSVYLKPLEGSTFGAVVYFSAGDRGAQLTKSEPGALARHLHTHRLLILRGLEALCDDPEQLLLVARLFGKDLEDYARTLTPSQMVHEQASEILVISNRPDVGRAPPPPPDPRGPTFPIQYPSRTGWHIDGSFRDPVPAISILLGVEIPAVGGETLFADATAALDSLDGRLQARCDQLVGLHICRGAGRTGDELQGPVHSVGVASHVPALHPVAFPHPVTGRKSIFLCDGLQMDYVDGPIRGLTPGPNGEGANLARRLLQHATQPKYVYVHRWQTGDLVVSDNRALLHCATWFDSEAEVRTLWRVTVCA